MERQKSSKRKNYLLWPIKLRILSRSIIKKNQQKKTLTKKLNLCKIIKIGSNWERDFLFSVNANSTTKMI